MPELTSHDLCMLREMDKLPQPFSLQDCAPFYGEGNGSLRVSPSIREVVARLLTERCLRLAKGRYYVAVNVTSLAATSGQAGTRSDTPIQTDGVGASTRPSGPRVDRKVGHSP